MRKLLTVLALWFCCACWVQAAENQLLGTWEIVSATDGGQVLPADLLKDMVLILTDKQYQIKTLKGEVQEQYEYTIQADANPHTIELSKPSTKELYHGIFELEGDTLKVSVAQSGKAAAKDFKTGPDFVLYVFKRKK